MKTTNEEITISILVEGPSYKGFPGNRIVPFKVFKEDQQYRAVPLLIESERMHIGLQEVISFGFVNHCIIAERSMSEDTLEVINNLIQEMILQDVIF